MVYLNLRSRRGGGFKYLNETDNTPASGVRALRGGAGLRDQGEMALRLQHEVPAGGQIEAPQAYRLHEVLQASSWRE